MLDKGKSGGLPTALKDVIIVAIGVAVVLAAIWAVFNTNPFYVVASGSMEPTLMVNDVLVVRDGGSFDSLKVGDIIVFNQPSTGDKVIVHRIKEIRDVDGERIIQTKGDNNPGSIPGTDYPITRSDYIGKVIYVIPGVGGIAKIIAPPVNYIIIAIILAILFFSRMTGGSKDGNSNDKQSSSPPPSSSSEPPNQPPPPGSP